MMEFHKMLLIKYRGLSESDCKHQKKCNKKVDYKKEPETAKDM